MSQNPVSKGGRRRLLGVYLVVAALIISAPTVARGFDGFTSPLIIHASEFENTAVWSLGTLDRFSESYGFLYAAPDELTSLVAPVYLPAGAEITKFEAAVADLISHDPNSSNMCVRFYPDVEVDLMSNHMYENIYPQDSHVVTHAQVTSTLDNGTTHIASTTSITEPVVNNLQQIFWVRVWVCGSFQSLQAVRIHYKE